MNQQNVHKILFLFTISLQLISIVLLYVISFIWLSRIYPYFTNGVGITYWIYRILSWQIIYISINFLIYLIIVSYYCAILKCDKTKFLSAKIIFIFTISGVVLNAPNVGSGLWLSFQAIERDNTITNRCYIYILNGLIGADSKYFMPEYKKWRDNFVSHVYDEDGHITKYLCENVSVPMLVSALALLVVICLHCACIYLTCKHLISNTSINVNVSLNDPLTVSFSSVNRRNGYT